MHCLTVVGARPQFIKAAVVSDALKRVGVDETIVHTGQHFDTNMSELFFADLGLDPPAVNLGVHGGSHAEMTAEMLIGVEHEIFVRSPDVVIVYGDTTSTLAAALAAVKLHVPVAHVEAGLRSFNRSMPEEINRVVTDHVSDVLFTPTSIATDHLRREGIEESKINQVGDVMYDATLHFRDAALPHETGLLEHLGISPGEYILATVHRAENTDSPERLETILAALDQIASEMPVVLPLHPRTRQRLDASITRHIRIIDPVGYLEMLLLESQAAIICTDSGGVQKEAYFHRVPCVTLRDETEWTELIHLGWNRLAPPSSAASIVATVHAALTDGPGREASPYGDGRAAERVANALLALYPN